MVDDDEVLANRLLRAARPPSAGNRLNAVSGGHLAKATTAVNTIVDSVGQVRRRWQPGDPWSSDYFFGGSSN